ncbi:MAG: sigma-54-dependent Fis family transcriptional regulator [Planctomycetaceae bacterium]|nr:sigma-54-dependent Fis family transcriptional regulator [Planctomycetaceae bacterium]
MNLPKLRSEQPGQASVLIAGCSDDSTTAHTQTVLKLGHRVFHWASEQAIPEIVTDQNWNLAICGPQLSASQIHKIAESATELSRILWIDQSSIPHELRKLTLPLTAESASEQQATSIRQSIELSLLHEERDDWRRRFTSQLFRDLVCRSEAMQTLQTQLLDEADKSTPLLLIGPPGADDRQIVWTLHQSGSRVDHPCLTIDCESYSSTAFEQELFQYRDEGDEQSPPLLEQVDGGTLLLKNPHSLSQTLQKKLIRFLESPAISRPDSHSLRYINIRWCFSFSTEQWPDRQSPLSRYLEERNDLTPLGIPALKDRRDDLRELIRKSLSEHAVRAAQLPPVLSADAWQLLEQYDWPGNEQQMHRVLSQITHLTSSSTISSEVIAPWLESDNLHNESGLGLMSLADMERQLIEATFNRFAGNRERTAQALGIGLRTLSGKLRQYGYPPRGGPGSNRRSAQETTEESARRAA